MLESNHNYCPNCGEPIELVIDLSVANQEYIEDCQVCCRPMVVTVDALGDGSAEVFVRREDD